MSINELKQAFVKQYGGSVSDILTYFSPGRVNLIGEHTDYNGGYVFPCALTYGTYLLVRCVEGNNWKFASTNFDYTQSVDITNPIKKYDGAWIEYPLGVLVEFQAKGLKASGLELLYSGTIPNGAGLSSSASIELVTSVALNEIYKCNIDTIELVKLSQRAENKFIGVNCGIMDQFAVGMGKKDKAIFLKCDTLDYELVPVVMEGYKLVIANTNKRRGLADSKYNERRSECESAVEFISKEKKINFLGDLSYEEFKKYENLIPSEVVKRRAKHVVTEIKRTSDAVGFLKNNDLKTFGQLMNASHDSLRDDYEVTGIELDTLVEEARKIEGVLGSRMTGAGFGGCTVSIVASDKVDEFCKVVGENYQKRTGLKADFYVADIGDGASRLN